MIDAMKTRAQLLEENNTLRARVAELERAVIAGQRAERALRQSEDKFSKAFHTSPDSININRLVDGVYIAVNQGFTDLTGYTPEEVIGKSSLELNLWHNPNDRARLVAELREQGEVVGLEAPFCMKDGAIKIGLVSARVIEVDGETYILSVTRDISDRKRLEEELQRYSEHLEELVEQRTAELSSANQQLRALSQVKDEFVSNVSHELRTPLASIKVNLKLASDDPGRVAVYLSRLNREVDRLHTLIEDLLLLSRLDQHRIEFNLSRVDITRLAAQYVEDRAPLAESKKLALMYDVATGLPPAQADEGLLGQVISILLTNALNYTPSGGMVRVSAQTSRMEGEQWVGFSVSDSGPGISAEEQAHIFERFYRGRVGRESKIGGTGLGLAIAQEIIARHQGWIDVQSSGVPGYGATFSVWLRPVA